MNILIRSGINLNSNDCLEFINQSDTDEWNQLLYTDIAKNCTDISLRPLYFSQSTKIQKKLKSKINKVIIIRFVFINLSKLMYFFSKKFSSQRFFIYYSYLNFKSIIKLKQRININLLPYFSFQSPISITNTNLRKFNLIEKSDDEFCKAICEIIPRIMPKCYLEGYNELADFKTYWPNDPKVIMTANAFAYDDVWGAWAAHKTEFGSKLVIAQHGGTYGASEFMDLQEYEISISDK
jgi:putative transferase (TIGR04331 family)